MRETKQVNKMSDVYKNCPAFENDRFLLRFSQLNDASDLVSVYSDKNALPFFNSDNCHIIFGYAIVPFYHFCTPIIFSSMGILVVNDSDKESCRIEN